MASPLAQVERRERCNDLLGFEGDGNDLAKEADDIARVILAVRIVDDAGAGVGGDAILVDHPLEGGAVAEAVVEGSGGDTAEGKEIVVAELGSVFRELHAFDPGR